MTKLKTDGQNFITSISVVNCKMNWHKMHTQSHTRSLLNLPSFPELLQLRPVLRNIWELLWQNFYTVGARHVIQPTNRINNHQTTNVNINLTKVTFDIYCSGTGRQIASDTKHMPRISWTVRKYNFSDMQVTAAIISIRPANCRPSEVFGKRWSKYVFALLRWKTTV